MHKEEMEKKDTYSEAWRMECEARHVLNLGGLMARRAYLELIESKRGVDARKALETVIKVEWKKMKAIKNENPS